MSLTNPLPLAQALIRCPSVTPANAGAIEVVEQALTTLGFTCRRLTLGADRGRPAIENLYARRGTAAPNICFAGHTDVVPVGQGWTVEPFAATVVDGVLYGRGAADMKGAIACWIAAVARLLDHHPDLPGSLSLLITGDEEGRSLDGTVRVLEALASSGETLDLCVVGEPTNPLHLGDMMKIGRRGSLNGKLTVYGVQGHAAYPHLADNPIPKLLSLLNALTATPLDDGSAHFQPSSLVLTTVDVGNPATNVIPAQAKAGFNSRFNDLHSPASLEAELRRRLSGTGLQDGPDWSLEIEVSGVSFLTQPGPLTESLSAAITAETGRVAELSTSGGTSDARFIQAYCPVVEFGLVGQTMHKADERVSLADLEGLTRIYHRHLGSLLA